MWHATVNTLCNDETLPELLKNIDIGLVEVPPSPTSVLTLREISDEFFTRFPDRMRDHQAVLETLEIHYLKKVVRTTILTCSSAVSMRRPC